MLYTCVRLLILRRFRSEEFLRLGFGWLQLTPPTVPPNGVSVVARVHLIWPTESNSLLDHSNGGQCILVVSSKILSARPALWQMFNHLYKKLHVNTLAVTYIYTSSPMLYISTDNEFPKSNDHIVHFLLVFSHPYRKCGQNLLRISTIMSKNSSVNMHMYILL